MGQKAIKIAAIAAALGLLIGGLALELNDEASANALAAGHSEPFMGR